MALISCFECGRQISDRAVNCPGCGAPVTASTTHPEPKPGPAAASEPLRVRPVPQAAGYASPSLAPPPARSLPLAIGAVAVPVLLLVLHLGAIGLDSAMPMALLVIVGIAAAAVLLRVENLRGMEPRELVVYLRGKPALMAVIAALVVLAEAAALYLGVPSALARSRIDAALAATDPCAIQTVKDLEKATEEQQEKISKRTDECSSRLAAEKEQKRDQQCRQIAARLDKPLSPDDMAALGSRAALADRITKRALTADDLRSISEADMPCADAIRTTQLFWAAYVNAVVSTPDPWSKVGGEDSFTTGLWRALMSGGHQLSPDAVRVFATNVDEVAAKAAKDAKTADDLRGAKNLCELGEKLKAKKSDVCAYAVGKFSALKKQEEGAAAQKKAREEAIQAAKDAQDEARLRANNARCDAIVRQRQACMRTCDFPIDDPRGLACEDNCARRFPDTGCD